MQYVTAALVTVAILTSCGDDHHPPPDDAATIDAAPPDDTATIDAAPPDDAATDAGGDEPPPAYGTPCEYGVPGSCPDPLVCFYASPVGFAAGLCSTSCVTDVDCAPGGLCYDDPYLPYDEGLCYWPCPCEFGLLCIDPWNSIPVCSWF